MGLLKLTISLGHLYDEVNKFAPFGTGNPKPIFMIQDAAITAVKHFGKEKNHLELLLQKDHHPLAGGAEAPQFRPLLSLKNLKTLQKNLKLAQKQQLSALWRNPLSSGNPSCASGFWMYNDMSGKQINQGSSYEHEKIGFAFGSR